MKISKIRIKSLFGITQYEADGKNVELAGKNGTGKTSVIDAIRYDGKRRFVLDRP